MKSGKKEMKRKAYASVITTAIITVIILLGPAHAINLGLENFSNISPLVGQIVSTIASINIESNEFFNIKNITLSITGAENRSCVFNASGAQISGCNGISIFPIFIPQNSYGYSYGYGYGYGFGTGNLSYNISIYTENFSIGAYNFTLEMNSNIGIYSSPSRELNIAAPQPQQSSQSQQSGGGGSSFINVSNKSLNLFNFSQNSLFDSSFNQLFNPLESSDIDNGNEGNESFDEKNKEIQDNGIFSRITGAVIGLAEESSIFVIIIIILIIGAAFIIVKIRIKNRSLNPLTRERFYY